MTYFLRFVLILNLCVSGNALSQVVFNEIYVRPDGSISSPPQGIIYDGSKEYIELYNKGCSPVNVAGYFIACKNAEMNPKISGFTIRIPNVPEALIPSGGHIVIGPGSPGTGVAGKIDIPVKQENICLYSGNAVILNANGWLALYDPTGKPLDCVYWSASAGNITSSSYTTSFDPGAICLPTGSPDITLKTAMQIFNDPTTKSLVSYIPNVSPILIYRETDGSDIWNMYTVSQSSPFKESDLPWSIDRTTPTGLCNGGLCKQISPTLVLDIKKDTICVGETANLIATANSQGGEFLWSTGPKTSSISVNPTTSTKYSVTYTALNGCTTSKEAWIEVLPLPTINGGGSVCKDATLQLTGSATAAATNPWVSSNTAIASISKTGLLTGVSVGTTTITYTNNNGCSTTTTITVNALPTISGNTVLCLNATSQLTGTGIAASLNPWFSSNTAVATINNIGLVSAKAKGTSTITYKNSLGCSNTAIITVTDPITPTFNPVSAICLGADLSKLPTTSNNSINGTWSPALNNTATTTYTFTPNSGQCANIATMKITVNSSATVSAGVDATICSRDSIKLNGSFGGAATSIVWSGGLGRFNPNNKTKDAYYIPSASEILAGNVTLIITTNDPDGPCNAASDNLTITIQKGAIVDAGPIEQSICARDNARLNGSFGGNATSIVWAGGTGNFSNVVDPKASYGPSSSEIAAGKVTLYITTDDPPGICGNVKDSVVIKINALPDVEAGLDTFLCLGQCLLLNAKSSSMNVPITFTWNNGGTQGSSFCPTNTSVKMVVTATDAFNCKNKDSLLISFSNVKPPVVSAGPDTTICFGEQLTLFGRGEPNVTYTWNNGVIDSKPFKPTKTDTYIVTGKSNLTRCFSIDSKLLTVNPSPNVIITTNDSTLCIGDTAFLLATGALKYQWLNGGPPSADYSFIPDKTAKYSVIGFNQFGCADTASISVLVNYLPNVNAGEDTTFCSGDSIKLSGSFGGAATSIEWSGGLGKFNPNNKTKDAYYTPTASEIAAKKLTLTLKTNDSNASCSSVSDAVTFSIQSGAIVNAGVDQSVCAGNLVQLNGSFGGIATGVIWEGGTGNFSNMVNPKATYSPSLSDISAGKLTLYLTTDDPPGVCGSVKDSVVIQFNAPPNVDAGKDTILCSGQCLLLNAKSSSMNVPITFTWNNGGTQGSSFCPTNNSVKMVVVATDAFNCKNKDSLLISFSNAKPPVVSAGPNQAICFGLQQTLSGTGDGNLTYLWNNGVIDSQPFQPLKSGVYIVTGKSNSTGCSSIDSMVLIVNPSPDLKIATPDSTLCIGDTAFLLATGALQYQWLNGGPPFANYSFIPDKTAKYSVIGRNQFGCTDTASIMLAVNSCGCDTTVLTLDCDGDGVTNGNEIDPDGDGIPGLNGTNPNDLCSFNVANQTLTPSKTWLLEDCDGDGISNEQEVKQGSNPKDACDPENLTSDCIDSLFVIPEIFTPNNDGINETFEILGIENYPLNSIQIFNRYGVLVFEKKPYNNEWRGFSTNKLTVGTESLPSGTYFYVLDLFGDATKVFTGYVFLKL